MHAIYHYDGWASYLIAIVPEGIDPQDVIDRFKAHPDIEFSYLDLDSLYAEPIALVSNEADADNVIATFVPHDAAELRLKAKQAQAAARLEKQTKQCRAQKKPINEQGFNWWPEA